MLKAHGASMTATQIYDVVLAATGSKSAAQTAFNRRRTAELRSGNPVPQ